MNKIDFHAPAGRTRLPVRIWADNPVTKQMLAAVLEPYFILAEDSAVLTVLCPDDGKMPALPRRGQLLIVCDESHVAVSSRIAVLPRPLDLQLFLETALALCAEEEYVAASEEYRCNDARKTVSYNGSTVFLTDKEYALFQILQENIGRTVSKEKLTRLLWSEGNNNACQVYITYLRKKLEQIAGSGVLVSVRGKGYMLHRP